MQHAVHNRATIRVADSTDVSGRVTAVEVNLDGFHSPIRKVRLIARTWLALVTVSLGLYLELPVCGLAQNNQGQNDQGINLVVPNGTYVFRDTGQVTPPGFTTPILIAAAGRETFFPTSNLGGTTSSVVTASMGGQISSFTTSGSFTVNPDGSVTTMEHQNGGPTLHFTEYPTPDGNTITFVADRSRNDYQRDCHERTLVRCRMER